MISRNGGEERRGVGVQLDKGFSIVEMIIAMFLLAVLALAVLPLLIGATQASSVNKSLNAATTFAGAQLAPIRADFPAQGTNSCAAVHATAGSAEDLANGLESTVVVGTCPGVYPGTVTVTVTVYRAGEPSSPLITIPTRVLVSGS
ncbi:prepilin-type N-terminal cleavage/methylation domain-containing protein [Microbacterium lacus]|uniref:prepilin-type N-terminal cleavage/methylation domain-containing protein n=1 Tax=Microbacterium lacus TaxID=415217 RepID=UPI00384C0FD7